MDQPRPRHSDPSFIFHTLTIRVPDLAQYPSIVQSSMAFLVANQGSGGYSRKVSLTTAWSHGSLSISDSSTEHSKPTTASSSCCTLSRALLILFKSNDMAQITGNCYTSTATEDQRLHTFNGSMRSKLDPSLQIHNSLSSKFQLINDLVVLIRPVVRVRSMSIPVYTTLRYRICHQHPKHEDVRNFIPNNHPRSHVEFIKRIFGRKRTSNLWRSGVIKSRP